MKSGSGRHRLLLIGPLPPPIGGVSAVYESLINSKLTKSFDLKILNICGGTNQRALGKIGRFSIGKVVKAFSHLVQLTWIMLRWRPAAVYLSFNSAKWSGYRDSLFIRIAHLLGAAVVVRFENCRFHEHYESGSRRRKRRIFKVFSLVSSVHVGDQQMRMCVSSVLPKCEIVIIPNGIDGKRLLEIASERNERKPTKNILFLGRIEIEKGILDLIEAFDIIAAEEPECELILAGPLMGKDKLSVLKRISRSPFESRIHLHGEVAGESKITIFREADVFVLPTHLREGCSIVLIEASAAGLPIIAGNIGSIVSTLSHGEGGYLVPVGGVNEIALRVRILFGDNNLYKKFSRFNVGRFKERFTEEMFIDKIVTDILETLQDSHGR